MGTLAVAPDLEAISALTPRALLEAIWMCRMSNPDTPFYLPVFNPGALVYTADCHGHQGQGELCGVALEITSKVTLVFDRHQGTADRVAPHRIRPGPSWSFGSARPMEDAARIAYLELILWMEQSYGFTKEQAYELLTQVGGLYVGNMVDTTYSLVASIKQAVFATKLISGNFRF